MNRTRGRLKFIPCMDSDEIAGEYQRALDIERGTAMDLGRSAVSISRSGCYLNRADEQVDLKQLVNDAVADKVSIPPDQSLADSADNAFDETTVQVTNETTLIAAQRLAESGRKPLALNFANGVSPGGGFLSGARAQEEVLCRSSGLFLTLLDDPMYEHHRQREQPDSTDWSIYSPHVPVFRNDSGTELDQPWLLSFLTCAAPYAPTIGQPLSGDLLQRRIHRVLAIARAFGYHNLVLGAWGCGAFGNDPHRTAANFRNALETEFEGNFFNIVFAITDWSPERRFLGPFRDVFSS